MRKRTILLMILFIGIGGLIFSFPTVKTSALLGDDYFEDFEGPVITTDWITTGFWHLEDNYSSNWPIHTWIPTPSHYMWYGNNQTGNFDTGGYSNSGTLTSDIIDLTLFEERIRLGFWSWAETEDGTSMDLKWVEISPDDGLNWYFLGYIPISYDWQYYSFDITEYGYSSNARIRFVFDSVDEYMNTGLGWRLDNIDIVMEPANFDLCIYQGRNALVNETRRIDFEIWSQFNQGRDAHVTITITNPSLVNETLFDYDYVYVERLSNWFYSLDYTFKEEGQYRVILEVMDYAGGSWWTDCYWEIGPYLELWIEQEYHALQYEEREMRFFVQNHFDEGLDFDVAVMIHKPSGTDDVFEEYDQYISAHDKWEKNYWYYFTEEGDYQVTFGVIDQYDRVWWTDCWWRIGPYFNIWIEQEWEGHPGETKQMDFYVDSFFDQEMFVDISIIMYTPNGVEEILYEAINLYLLAWDSWSHSLSYTFNHPGKYNVKLLLIDETGRWWEYWCCWEVWSKFELWIDQDTYGQVGEEKWMDFHVKSYFNHTMEVKVSVEITKPNGDVDLLFQEDPIYIDAYGSWDYSDSYVFNEAGEYKVQFILVDDIENEWIVDCWWDIQGEDGTGPDDNGTSDQDMISPGFEGFTLALAIVTIVLAFKKRK